MKQEIKNFGKFFRLLGMMPGNDDPDRLKKELVWRFTDLRTDSLREMSKAEYDRMTKQMERLTGGLTSPRKRDGYYGDDAEKWRKRAIASVFGFYQKIREPVTLDYVKRIICRAGGETDINRIPPAKMREIYNCWRIKQQVKTRTDMIVADELEKYGY